MPKFKWEEKDMAGSLSFFPLVGAVIGALLCLLNIGPVPEMINPYVRALLSVLIPVLITGGFHLDGFMDTCDAGNSYGEREKKLEILKDPHIGAFSVISVIKMMLALLAVSIFILTSENITPEILIICGFVFVISRCFCGISSVFLKKAKKSGMLVSEAGNVKRTTWEILFAQLMISVAVMVFLDLIMALTVVSVFVLYFFYYKYRTEKEFGGVTGDTAGYFVCVSETLGLYAVAIVLLIKGIM